MKINLKYSVFIFISLTILSHGRERTELEFKKIYPKIKTFALMGRKVPKNGHQNKIKRIDFFKRIQKDIDKVVNASGAQNGKNIINTKNSTIVYEVNQMRIHSISKLLNGKIQYKLDFEWHVNDNGFVQVTRVIINDYSNDSFYLIN